jgi:methionine-rich copper-binding protein CopC
MPVRVPRRGIAVAGVALFVAVSVIGLAAPAYAHNYLVSSTPASGATLERLPSKFSITTNEALLDLSGHGAGFAFDIEDSAGRFYGDGCVTVDGPTMSTPASLGSAGKYKVYWQIVSADGHVVSNDYSFTWKPSAAFTPATGASHPQDCGGRSGGTAPPDPTLGQDYTKPSANLGLVLGIGGGVLALGVVLAIVLVVVTRRRPAAEGDGDDEGAPAP